MWGLWVPDYLRDEGLTVHLYPGWETRTRVSSPDGLAAWMGHVIHHTVSSQLDPETEARFLAELHPVKPVGNTYLPRDGEWWVLAAGATNTNGSGGPYLTSRGAIAEGNGNLTMWATEAANNGVGEPWPQVQQESYVRGCIAISKGAERETPGGTFDASCTLAHSEWAPLRKVDPGGPSMFATSGEWADFIWSPGVTGMDKFRGQIFEGLIATPDPTPDPDPTPTPQRKQQLMWITKMDKETWRIGDLIWARDYGANQATTAINKSARDGQPLFDWKTGDKVTELEQVKPADADRPLGKLVSDADDSPNTA